MPPGARVTLGVRRNLRQSDVYLCELRRSEVRRVTRCSGCHRRHRFLACNALHVVAGRCLLEMLPTSPTVRTCVSPPHSSSTRGSNLVVAVSAEAGAVDEEIPDCGCSRGGHWLADPIVRSPSLQRDSRQHHRRTLSSGRCCRIPCISGGCSRYISGGLGDHCGRRKLGCVCGCMARATLLGHKGSAVAMIIRSNSAPDCERHFGCTEPMRPLNGPPNSALQPSHSRVTARAYRGTRRAARRSAERERWTDESL